MTIARLFVDSPPQKDGLVKVNPETMRYLKTVLRIKSGEKLFLSSRGSDYETIVEYINEQGVVVRAVTEVPRIVNDCEITLCQSLLKADKMDLIVQKATEFGVTRVIPFSSSRSIVRYDGAKAIARVERWEKISIEAARKSGRDKQMNIAPIVDFASAAGMPAREEYKIFFWEEEEKISLRDVIKTKKFKSASAVCFVIGPEGGFSQAEAGVAKTNDFISVSLGRVLLKAETAAIGVCAIFAHEKGFFEI